MPDTRIKRAFAECGRTSVNLRLTWQATATGQDQLLLRPALALPVRHDVALVAQEAANQHRVSDQRSDVGRRTRRRRRTALSKRGSACAAKSTPTRPTTRRTPQRLLIPVIEQGGLDSGPAVSRRRHLAAATQPYQRTLGVSIPFGASLSYVPGGHSFKFGFYNVTAQRTSNVGDNASHLTYRFLNGVPNQLTQRATPLYRAERQKMDLGIFAQDKWTLNG